MKRHSTRTVLLAAMAVGCAFARVQARPIPSGTQIPWRLPAYTLVAREMDLRTAIDTFAVAEGVPAVMSPSVQGVFSADFKDVPPSEFLDKLATTHNLMWYYDGAALYLYGASEISTMLLDLQYMKAGEVRDMLSELGVEDERYPIKTALDNDLIMVSGPPRYVALVSDMISKADKLREKRTYSEVEARIFPLTYTWADDVSFGASSPEGSVSIKGVATLLNDLMASGDGYLTESGDTSGAVAAEVAQAIGFKPLIRPETRLNAVIVRDVASRMPMYQKLIEKLDVPQKLIEIDVTVVEMSQKNALDWQLSVAGTGSRGHNTIGAGQNANNLFNPESLGGQGLAGAVTHMGSHYNISASLTALRERGKARSISRTQLLTVNNLAAEMTDSQSYHAKVVGTEVASLQEVSAGTKLSIKPRILHSISDDIPNQVWMSLQLDDGGFESITVDAMPMSRSSTLLTQTAIFEDESIMLAGYLRDIEEDAGWGIPFLRDIPIIGWLFGGKSTRKETVQRIFILTPHIVDLDAEMLIRLQATHLRDVEVAREVMKDKEEDKEEEGEKERKRRPAPQAAPVEEEFAPVEYDASAAYAAPAEEFAAPVAPVAPVAEVVEVPEVPEAPAVPEEPAVSEVAVPEVAEVAVPEVEEVAPVPEVPEAPAVPDVAPVAEVPEAPAVPEEPAAEVAPAPSQVLQEPAPSAPVDVVVPSVQSLPEAPEPDLEGISAE